MSGTLQMLRSLRNLEQPGVLATLVGVAGSSYRKPGARLLLGPEGPRTGNVSAGCLEADLQARVADVLASGRPQLVNYDLGAELDLVWGTGMGCQGCAEILLEPALPGRPLPWVHFCAQQLERRRTCALITVLSVRGDAGLEPGDRFAYDERNHGLLPIDPQLSVELGRLSTRVREEGGSARPRLVVREGEVEVLVEALVPSVALWLYGAGEPARILASLAAQLGWSVGVADHRPALITEERFPFAEWRLAGPPADTLKGLTMDARSAAVVLSHVYDRDREALARFLVSGAAYVGLQGSRKRSEKLLAELEAEGLVIPEAARAHFYFPVGLDLGAEAPEAIALSILAEVQAVLAGRRVGHLRDRQGAIH